MKTFILAVLVVQSGQSPEDAKAVLEMNLSEVLPPNDFEVIPVAASASWTTSLNGALSIFACRRHAKIRRLTSLSTLIRKYHAQPTAFM